MNSSGSGDARDSAVLNVCSLVYEESELFQKRNKQWLSEVLATNAGKKFPKDSEIIPVLHKLLVKKFTAEIFPEVGERSFPRHHPILKFQVVSQVEGSVTECTNHLIVKILDDSQLEEEDNFAVRELNFYKDAIPHLLDWAESQGHKVTLGVPKYYYGKYLQEGDRIGCSETTESMDMEELLLLDTMSTLVLEDLSIGGFHPSTNKSSLSREEVRSAIRELALFHSLSWAYQQMTQNDITQGFNFCENVEEFVNGTVEIIEESYPKLTEFLKTNVTDGHMLLAHLDSIKLRLHSTMTELLSPPMAEEGPSCLLHMDFWTQNLLFRSLPIHGGIVTQCRILDWQHVIYGSPTHDIACLLLMSISSSYRSIATNVLLELYWNCFKENCKNLKVNVPYGFACIQAQYEKSRLLPLLMMMGSIGIELDIPTATEKFLEILRESIEKY